MVWYVIDEKSSTEFETRIPLLFVNKRFFLLQLILYQKLLAVFNQLMSPKYTFENMFFLLSSCTTPFPFSLMI